MDKFNYLMDIIIEEKSKQEKIIEAINQIEFPYRNILFKVYIQGKSLVTVASEMGYDYKYMCKMHRIALEKFDNTTKEV